MPKGWKKIFANADYEIRDVGGHLELHFGKDLPSNDAVPSPGPNLLITVDCGDAAPEEIAELLADLSLLYRRVGGSGIDFSLSELHLLAPEEV